MKDLLAQHAEKFRFALVGGFNTALDFGILFGLTAFGVYKIVANYISKSISFIFSFFANNTFTFKAKSGNAKREFISFVIVTLIGLWVLQPLIITAISRLLAATTLNDTTILLIAKLLATIVSLIWNYVFYSRVVFKQK
jgi:putative flippase GtrA